MSTSMTPSPSPTPTPTPMAAFERAHDPVAQILRVQLAETEEQALEATVFFLAMKGSVADRSAAFDEKDAAAMTVDALRSALAHYIVAGVSPLAKLGPRATGRARRSALDKAVARWRETTAKALEQRLLSAGVW